MGVKACYRHKCENVMCDHLINDGAYCICNDCLDELKTFQATWEDKNLPLIEVSNRIDQFMGSCPGTHKILSSKEEIDAEFRRLIGG